MGFFDFMTEEIAIDLGTANTLIIHQDKVVVDEPSIVARDMQTNEIVAIGTRAQQMQGKTHKKIETIRPLKDGVIADFQSSEQMLRGFIKMSQRKRSLLAPSVKMVICIPSGVTEVEKRAVIDSAEHAGAKEVFLMFVSIFYEHKMKLLHLAKDLHTKNSCFHHMLFLLLKHQHKFRKHNKGQSLGSFYLKVFQLHSLLLFLDLY